MKVLIIVENLPVPFDRRVWREARSLRVHGHEVTVLCPRGKGYRRSHEVIDGIHIYRHPMPKEGSGPLGYLCEYGCALFYEFWYAWWIYLRHGFQVIQGCNPPDLIFLIALPFKLLRVKYIFDHHDLSPELYLSKYGKKGLMYKAQLCLERLSCRSADAVMATNRSYRDLDVSRGSVNPEDIFIVRNGPTSDMLKSIPPNQTLKHGKRYLVGYVGTMNAQEGLEILVEAAEHIKESGRIDVHFTCIGGGPALAGLLSLVREKHLDDTVNFTGRIPDKEMLEILSTADVCVNPDRPCQMNDLSTMVKITEYMALGKPIVQFNLKEGRFTAGEASLYAENSDGGRDFADKILWLLDHAEERRRMGEFGRRRIEEELSWEHSVKHLLAAYQRAMTSGRGERQETATARHERRETRDEQEALALSSSEELVPSQVARAKAAKGSGV